MESKNHMRLYNKHYDVFSGKVEKAKATLDEDKYKELVPFLKGDANRMRDIDLEAQKVKYASGTQKPRLRGLVA